MRAFGGAYMIIASKIEERDLLNHFGRIYENYRREVPAFLPRFRRQRKASEVVSAEATTLRNDRGVASGASAG